MNLDLKFPYMFTRSKFSKIKMNATVVEKLKNVLLNTKYCSICLENAESLSNLETSIQIPKLGNNFIILKDILKEIFGNADICFGGFICYSCMTLAIDSYSFIRKTKEYSKIYAHYLINLYQKIEEPFTNTRDESKHMMIVLDNFLKKDYEPSSCKEESNQNIKIECEINVKPDSSKSYRCACCDKQFKTRKQLIGHIKYLKRRNNRNLSKCPQCSSLTCVHKKYLNSFNNTKSFKRIAKCFDCDYQCITTKALIKHVNKEHLKLKYDCNSCGRVFHYKPNCDKHKTKCELTAKPFKCDKCPASFKHKIQAQFHKREHADVNWECYICSKWFLERTYLRQHINRYHIFDSYECSVCQKECGDAVNLHTHLLTHSSEEVHKCLACEIQFKTRNNFVDHVKSKDHLKKTRQDKELQKRKVLCTICYKECEDMTEYKAHKKNHKLGEKHRCNICKLTFNTRKEYTVHTRQAGHKKNLDPGQVETLKCSYCDYTTFFRPSLQNHINCKHLYYMPHECHICGRKFSSRNVLNYHIRRHTDAEKIRESIIREHTCNLCGKMFRSKIAWQKHMMLHTGERPYPCDQCDQAFISASHRSAHKARQHMERRFQCPLCEATRMFPTLANLRSHVKKAHWKKPGKFDYRQLEGLSEEDYDLFRDRRKIA